MSNQTDDMELTMAVHKVLTQLSDEEYLKVVESLAANYSNSPTRNNALFLGVMIQNLKFRDNGLDQQEFVNDQTQVHAQELVQ
jgi:hypothetical protein